MPAVFQKTVEQDLHKPLKIQYCADTVFTKDNAGNQINVLLFEDGEPYSSGGTVSATAIRADGATESWAGTISGNTVSVALTRAALDVPGTLQVFIKVTAGTTETTVYAGVYNVVCTETPTVVAPVTPSDVAALIASIEAAIRNIPADWTSFLGTIAPTFDPSKEGGYAAGAYVWYPGQPDNVGTLYRFTSAHSGTWTGTDVVTVVIGNELNDTVRYTQQVKTDAEKTIARANIGAADADDVVDLELTTVQVTPQTFDDNSKSQARSNIGAASSGDLSALSTLVNNQGVYIGDISASIGTVPTGETVEGQITDLKSAIEEIDGVVYRTRRVDWRNYSTTVYPLGWTVGFYKESNGTINELATCMRSLLLTYNGYRVWGDVSKVVITAPAGYFVAVFEYDLVGTYQRKIGNQMSNGTSSVTFVPAVNRQYCFSVGYFPNYDANAYINDDFIDQIILTEYIEVPKETENRVADIESLKDGKILWPSSFKRGNMTNATVESDLQYRIISTELCAFNRRSFFTVADGFQVKLITYDITTRRLISVNANWFTGSFAVEPDYAYRILIARTEEDTSEIADIDIFKQQVFRPYPEKSDIAEYIYNTIGVHTDCTQLVFSPGYYYYDDSTASFDTNKHYYEKRCGLIAPCNSGDVIYVRIARAVRYSAFRGYAFLNADREVISLAAIDNSDIWEAVLTAPDNSAYIILNSTNPDVAFACKGVPVKDRLATLETNNQVFLDALYSTKAVSWSGLGTSAWPLGWRNGYRTDSGEAHIGSNYIRTVSVRYKPTTGVVFFDIDAPSGYAVRVYEYDEFNRFVKFHGAHNSLYPDCTRHVRVYHQKGHQYAFDLGFFDGEAEQFITSEFIDQIRLVETAPKESAFIESNIPWSFLATATYPYGWAPGYYSSDGHPTSSQNYIRTVTYKFTPADNVDHFMISAPEGYAVRATDYYNGTVIQIGTSDISSEDATSSLIITHSPGHSYNFHIGKFDGDAENYLTESFIDQIKLVTYARTSLAHLNILVLGNSYSADSWQYVPFILLNYGITSNIYVYYRGSGSIFRLHEEWTDTSESGIDEWGASHIRRLFHIDTRKSTRWSSGRIGYSPKMCVELVNDPANDISHWDLITLQTGARSSMLVKAPGGTDPRKGPEPYVQKVLNLIRDSYDKPFTLGWFYIYTGFDGKNKSGYKTLTPEECDNRVDTLKAAEALYKAESFGLIIPAAAAVFDARTNAALASTALSATGNLWYSDRLHLQNGIPCYIANATVVQSLFNKFFPQYSILGDTTRITDDLISMWNALTPSIHGAVLSEDEDLYRLAQKCAVIACNHPFDIVPIRSDDDDSELEFLDQVDRYWADELIDTSDIPPAT